LAGKLHYLGGLASDDIVVGAEVGHVLGRNARLAWAATRVAADNTSVMELGSVGIEGRVGRNILETLAGDGIVPTEGAGYHFGELASGDVIIGSEVGEVKRGYARFVVGTTRIATYDTSLGHSLSVCVEGCARRIIREHLAGDRLIKTSRQRHYLADLTSGRGVIGLEARYP
jgi:hypothetical protein